MSNPKVRRCQTCGRLAYGSSNKCGYHVTKNTKCGGSRRVVRYPTPDEIAEAKQASR